MKHIFAIVAISDALLAIAIAALLSIHLWIALIAFLLSRFIRAIAPSRKEPKSDKSLVEYISLAGIVLIVVWANNLGLGDFIWDKLIPHFHSWQFITGVLLVILAARIADWIYLRALTPKDVDLYYSANSQAEQDAAANP